MQAAATGECIKPEGKGQSMVESIPRFGMNPTMNGIQLSRSIQFIGSPGHKH